MSQLIDRIEKLISTCRHLDSQRRELSAALEQSEAENAHLRHLLANTHDRVHEITEQIRHLEDQAS